MRFSMRFSMRLSIRLLSLFVVLPLAGCGWIGSLGGDPSATGVPQRISERSEGAHVGLCYNGHNTSRDDLFAAARERCPEPGSDVRFRYQDLNLNDCPLFKKRRAVFTCIPPNLPGGPQ